MNPKNHRYKLRIDGEKTITMLAPNSFAAALRAVAKNYWFHKSIELQVILDSGLYEVILDKQRRIPVALTSTNDPSLIKILGRSFDDILAMQQKQ